MTSTMTEVKGVERRRPTQFLEDLRNTTYWELKKEAEYLKIGKDSFL